MSGSDGTSPPGGQAPAGGQPPLANSKPEDGAGAPAGGTEHLNIKVTDNNNEVFFKIKRTTQLKKLMDAFCERQGKAPSSVRFLFDGARVRGVDSPETVSHRRRATRRRKVLGADRGRQLEMQDGDTLEVHQEQIGG